MDDGFLIDTYMKCPLLNLTGPASQTQEPHVIKADLLTNSLYMKKKKSSWKMKLVSNGPSAPFFAEETSSFSFLVVQGTADLMKMGAAMHGGSR